MTDLKTPLEKTSLLPTDDVSTPPKVALKQRSLRAGEQRGQTIYRIGALIMTFSYVLLLWGQGDENNLSTWLYLGGMLISFVIFGVATFVTVRAQRKLKCQGCWKTCVRTPFCPWCGTKDPVGDYEEWVEQEKVKEEAKTAGKSKSVWWRKA